MIAENYAMAVESLNKISNIFLIYNILYVKAFNQFTAYF